MGHPQLTKGYVQVYTGDGKGKTTAALGLALRAAGWGLRTFICQFMKKHPYGEVEAIRQMIPLITIEQYGKETFVQMGKQEPEDYQLARQGLERARQVLRSGEYELVILDEINVALHFGLLPVPEVLELIDSKPAHVELVLTGRRAPQEILDRADLVTEMRAIKHYYDQGVPARKGIEE